MGSKSSTYPYYNKATITGLFIGHNTGSDIGHRYTYDDEMVWIPTESNLTSSSDIEGFFTKYGHADSNRFNNGLSGWREKCCFTFLPFNDPIVFNDFYNKTWVDVSSLTTLRILDLYEYGNTTGFIKATVNYSSRYGGSLSLTLSVAEIVSGAISTYGVAKILDLANVNSSLGITNAEQATTYVNSYMSQLSEIYVVPRNRCSSGYLAITTYDNTFCFGAKIGNDYIWGDCGSIPSAQFFTLADETEKDIYTPPEPGPEPPTPSSDPYSGGGYSAGGGGGGNYDTSSDPIPIPSPPADIASGTGLFTAYNPSASELASLSQAMWNKDPSTFSDWWRFFFGGDAFSAIIGLSMIPVEPITGSPPKEIYLGNWGTGVSALKITNQYKQVNFGSVTLSEFWGNAIDYSPYTRVQLALPYIGIVDVDTDDVIASVNTLTYNIDVYTGACTAMLHCVKGNLSSVIYEWTGNVSAVLPITGSSFSALTSGLIATAISSAGVATAMSGGTALPAMAGLGLAGSAISTFGSNKGKIQRSGNFSGNSGALGIQTPYFIISRPVQSVPSTQQATKGYPANISAHLGDLIGYTEITEINLEGINATEDELIEIKELLKKGVIF